MDKLYGILETVLPIVAMLGLGILFKRLRGFSKEGVEALKGLVLNLCLPALVFRTFSGVSYTWSIVGVAMTFFLLSCGGIALSFGYIVFQTISATFAVNGSMSPMLAVWIPNFTFLIIGIVLYWKAPK